MKQAIRRLLATAAAALLLPASAATEATFDLGEGNILTMVRTPNGLWFGKFEVTQRQWLGVMGGWNPVERAVDKGGDKPVAGVSTRQVGQFLAKLNAMDSVRKAGFSFRLPTAAEWTAACRAGSRGTWPLGADGRESSLDAMAWYCKTSRTTARPADPMQPVGGRAPNAWGLYDMLGNAEEMTSAVENKYEILARKNVPENVFCGGGVK